MRRVVVTGMGCVTPHGVGVDALWEGWIGGQLPFEDRVAPCRAFDPGDFMSRKEARRSDRYSQLAMAAIIEAAAQAGWDGGPPCEPARAGSIWGTQNGGLDAIERAHWAMFGLEGERLSTFAVSNMLANSPTALASIRWGLQGPSFAVGVACASGAQAVVNGVAMIRSGLVDTMVVGGSEASLTEFGRRLLAATEAVSDSGNSLPFDARRDGFVPGEGAGAIVLETLELAEARGATVLAEVRGIGMTNDAFHLTAPAPGGRGCVDAIGRALSDAGLAAEDISYVNAHGTGTVLNDIAEVAALKTALGEHAYRVPVSSLKSSIGHLIGGAGAVETVATIRALQERTAPPTLSWAEAEEGLDLDFVVDGPRPLAVADGQAPVALKCSAGFGGHNVVVCLEVAA